MVKKTYNLRFPSGTQIPLEVELLVSQGLLSIGKTGSEPFYKKSLGCSRFCTNKEAILCPKIPVLSDDPEVMALCGGKADNDFLQVKFFKTEPWPETFLLCNGFNVETGKPDSSELFYTKLCNHLMYLPFIILLTLAVILGVLIFYLLFFVFLLVVFAIYKCWFVQKYDVNKSTWYNIDILDYLQKDDVPVVAIDLGPYTSSTTSVMPQIEV